MSKPPDMDFPPAPLRRVDYELITYLEGGRKKKEKGLARQKPPMIDLPPMPPFDPHPELITYLEGGREKKERKRARASRLPLLKRLRRS